MVRMKAGISLWVAVVLIAASYQKGMFFDRSFWVWEGMLCVTPLVGGSLRWRSGDPFKPLPSAVYGLFGLALLYALALAGRPASMGGTLEQALRYTAYAAFLWTGLQTAAGREGRRWWLGAMQLAGLFLLGGAMAGWLGWIHYPSLIMITDNIELSASGARLAGFIQYPNTLGALALAYLLLQWLLMGEASRKVTYLIYAAMSLLAALVCLLCESRGAWLAGGAGWLLACILLKRPLRVRWLVHSGWTLLAAALLYRLALPALRVDEPLGIPGSRLVDWQLAGLCAAAIAGFLAIRMWWQRQAMLPQWQAALFFSVTAVLSFTLLPGAASGRLSGGHYDTAAARTLFYTDSWQLFVQAPLFGRGGDTWRTMFHHVQSQPYVGSEVHSAYLDILLDVGLVGAALLLAVLAVLLVRIWRVERAGLAPVCALLLHAGIDFDMSFGCFWLLLLGFIIYYGSSEREGEHNAAIRHQGAERSRSRRWGGYQGMNRSRIRDRSEKVMTRITAVLIPLLLLTAALVSWRLDLAADRYDQAMQQGGENRMELLRKALSLNPYDTRTRQELASLAEPADSLSLLEEGLQMEPESASLWFAVGLASLQQGLLQEGARQLTTSLQMDRYNADHYTEAIQKLTQLAQERAKRGDQESAQLAAMKALAIMKQFEALSQVNYRVNGRQFGMTDEAQAAAAAARQLLGGPSE